MTVVLCHFLVLVIEVANDGLRNHPGLEVRSAGGPSFFLVGLSLFCITSTRDWIARSFDSWVVEAFHSSRLFPCLVWVSCEPPRGLMIRWCPGFLVGIFLVLDVTLDPLITNRLICLEEIRYQPCGLLPSCCQAFPVGSSSALICVTIDAPCAAGVATPWWCWRRVHLSW